MHQHWVGGQREAWHPHCYHETAVNSSKISYGLSDWLHGVSAEFLRLDVIRPIVARARARAPLDWQLLVACWAPEVVPGLSLKNLKKASCASATRASSS